ncbi:MULTISPECIES: aldo/keto reductase [unclassified Oceanispirochaeta]|uniref:aldo/keto reductase n=1 Tax=unclassified Oceanispirochaeta TaxID=2635722 RepID=UPI000E096FB2|nr:MULTISPECIES: aldo/keto reductase [unclassified Oceanispirochaeta]MBF9014585.1 aldo/keto reductase [Oceanispirochaeta sp. M2]NPD70841.1 aldo/keto reductase [Oceanispirochaeta sp. M1]RDG34122.1 aldo/keto reductase [Oceanispirochaeta sp. M1]
MKKRTLGKTGYKISEIGLGTWQLGGRWGDPYKEKSAQAILESAVENGLNFIDTADVYNDGMSEESIGTFLKSQKDRIYVATKCGRQINPHVSEGYSPEVLTRYVEDSLKRLQLETLDLIQLHCPPTQVYYRPEIFETFDRLKEQGKVQNLGVSVEKIEEASKAIEFPNVTSVQLIFNMFRHRPLDWFFDLAAKRNVGIIVRVPLASGLLTGKFSRQSSFTSGDHRNFNRDGKAFDKGETFSGVPYELGLDAVERLKELFGPEMNLAQTALRWILMHPQVSSVIPGASSREQMKGNAAAAAMAPLSESQMHGVQKIYDDLIKNEVHQLW